MIGGLPVEIGTVKHYKEEELPGILKEFFESKAH